MDRQLIHDLPFTIRSLPAQRSLVHEGDPSLVCCLVLEGWVCGHQMLDEGKRAILSLHMPGDLPNLETLHLPDAGFGIMTLSPATVACVPHAEIRRLMAGSPAIADALWKEMLVAASVHRAWMAGLGRREARGRLAHLFCELYLRLQAVGLAQDRTFAFPLRQTELADTLGLTNVHVNRVLSELRGSGLITLDGRRVEIRDWSRLCKIADFTPHYLHLPAAVAPEPERVG